jgi:hypothetical protein
MKVVAAEGTFEKIGFDLGCRLAQAIKHNVALREQNTRSRGVESTALLRFTHEYAELSSAGSLKLMQGLSRGSGVPFASILRFNALQDVISPEGCTSFAAVGSATLDGNAILLKNRDVSGNKKHTGKNYYHFQEINVALVLKTANGNVMAGVAVAGSTGFMMGLNKYGVAVASNFGQTTEVSHILPGQLYGMSGRTQMMREALECFSVKDAVNLVLRKLTDAPMGTPGVLWFADAGNIYVVEGSSGQFAVQHVQDGVVVRSNHFLLLDQLNNEKAVSSVCRKIRGNQLLEENYGNINKEKLMEFSMDHMNGPGQNSICRHGNNPEDSITVSASIMELNSKNPEKSKISIALGTPCWSWRSSTGNFTFQMDDAIENIPKRFLDGSVYKEFIKEEPWKEASA